ncbi:MAG TPA: hypothetical protein VK917_06105 [Ilumatobacter sp.]|nr:hypothetical protein [Ilumatobacter sp.]
MKTNNPTTKPETTMPTYRQQLRRRPTDAMLLTGTDDHHIGDIVEARGSGVRS